MRHFTVIIAALLFLSFTAGGAFAENKGNNGTKGKKIELTEQEMDSVSAAGAMAPNLAGFPGFVIMKSAEFAALRIAPNIPPKLLLPFKLLNPGAPH